MKYCINCGAQLVSEAKFCALCGTPISREEREQGIHNLDDDRFPNTHLDTPTFIKEFTEDDPFLMYIDDVFPITGRGVVGTGVIVRGRISVGEEVEIIGFDYNKKKVKISGITKNRTEHRKLHNSAVMNEDVGILLGGLQKCDIRTGQVISKPNSTTVVKEFIATSEIYAIENGGPISFNPVGHKAYCYFSKSIGVKTKIICQQSGQYLPGNGLFGKMKFDFEDTPIVVEEGFRFDIKDNERVKIGSGIVFSILA